MQIMVLGNVGRVARAIRAMGLLTVLSLTVGMTGCSNSLLKDCVTMVGPGWTVMASEPAQGKTLLMMESLPSDSDVRWFSKGDDQLLACVYSPPINNPSCDSSTGYIFGRNGQNWVYRDALKQNCQLPP